MGKPVNSNVKRLETQSVNIKVEELALESFRDYCKELGYSMNILLETFMNQFVNGNFDFANADDIEKYKKGNTRNSIVNTTLNKEIYVKFKTYCKSNGYSMGAVVSVFMECYSGRQYALEFVKVK